MDRFHRNFLLLCLVLVAGRGEVIFADVTDGLKTSVAVDIVGEGGTSLPTPMRNGIAVREAEMVFYAPSDYLFDGQLSLAAHLDAGVQVIDLHEAYIGSSKLIPRSRFRVGQFFLGVGRLNRFHRHDWPFTAAPKYFKSMFDSTGHGVVDSGIEYSWLAPLPFYLDLTFGVTNGFNFGHSHGAGTRPWVPTHYVRAELFWNLTDATGLQTGLNYLGRRDSTGTENLYLGIDATTKWREAKIIKFFLQSEVWYRRNTAKGLPSTSQWGFYLFPEIPLDDVWRFGVRFDYWSDASVVDIFGNAVSSYELGLTPTFTYKPSEFTTLRAGYNYQPRRYAGASAGEAHFIQLQAIFLLGAHPAHDF